MTAPLSLSAIRELHAGITPGPWRWDEEFGDAGDTGLALTNDAGAEIIGAYNHHCCSFRDDPTVEDKDAAFIAAAPTTVEQLLGIAERVEALSAEWFRELDNPDHLILLEDALEAIRAAITGEVRP